MKYNNLKVSIVVHGPIGDNAYKEIFDSFLPVKDNIDEVVISTYVGSEDNTKMAINKYADKFNVKCVFCKDLINPGHFNINRQLLTVNAGLKLTKKDSFIVKLRNDQWCDMKKLFDCLEKRYFGTNPETRVLSTNCFTRSDRLYHPSDMFLCGWKNDILEYYSMPQQINTHMDIQLEMIHKIKYSNEEFQSYMICPESSLFKHYLSLKDWDFKYTFEDSYEALKKYICLINTWDIDLRWNKQRNAFLPAKTIILPYSFSLAPFEGAPVEQAKCYARHDFEGHKTFRDRRFLFWARFVFSVKYNKIHRMLVKIKNKTPRFIKTLFRGTAIGRFFKSLIQ